MLVQILDRGRKDLRVRRSFLVLALVRVAYERCRYMRVRDVSLHVLELHLLDRKTDPRTPLGEASKCCSRVTVWISDHVTRIYREGESCIWRRSRRPEGLS